MPIISLSVSESLLKKLDAKLSGKGYSGRSEAIRELLRTYVSEKEWSEGTGEGSIAVVTVLYEKDAPRDAVSEIQHEYEHMIQTSIHTHLDEENCMEVFIARGNGKKLAKLIDRIKTVKGVKQVKYITSASGV